MRCFLGMLCLGGMIFLHGARGESAQDGNYVPEIARSLVAEGNQAFEEGRYPAAKEAYEKVLKLVPGNLLGLINLGSVYYRMGDTKNAERVLLDAIRKRLETAPAWTTLGLVYLDANQLDEAIGAFAQAALYDARNPKVHNYFGVAIGRKGWRDGAEAELRRALEIDPEYGEAHFNLAVFYLERTPPAIELARRHYKRARELGMEADPILEKRLASDASQEAIQKTEEGRD